MARKDKDKTKNKSIPKSQLNNLKKPVILIVVVILLTILQLTKLQDTSFKFTYKSLKNQTQKLDELNAKISGLYRQRDTIKKDTQIYQDILDRELGKLKSLDLNRIESNDLESFIRYLDFRANDCNIKLNDTKIEYTKDKKPFITCSLSGDYTNVTNYFNTLNTQELTYIKKLKVTNNGSDVSVKFIVDFTGNTNPTQPEDGTVPENTTTPDNGALPKDNTNNAPLVDVDKDEAKGTDATKDTNNNNPSQSKDDVTKPDNAANGQVSDKEAK